MLICLTLKYAHRHRLNIFEKAFNKEKGNSKAIKADRTGK